VTAKPAAFVPSVFRPRRWLRGGHVQTLGAFFLPRRIDLAAAEERLVEVEPGVPVLCHCHWQKDRRALTLIVVHGLEGSSESQYMLGIARNGLAAGMNVVRMNQRNCGGMDHSAPTLYNSGRSADVAAVARNLVERDGIPGFVLIGFSMGGNLVLKLAGEWRQSVRRLIWRLVPTPFMSRAIESTNIIFCCNCSSGFAARRGCFPRTLMLRACAELRHCGTLMTA
jgi:predicted alpha/beta-fold hydrolase